MVKDDAGPAVSTRKRKAEEEHVQPLGAYCSVFFSIAPRADAVAATLREASPRKTPSPRNTWKPVASTQTSARKASTRARPARR